MIVRKALLIRRYRFYDYEDRNDAFRVDVDYVADFNDTVDYGIHMRMGTRLS